MFKKIALFFKGLISRIFRWFIQKILLPNLSKNKKWAEKLEEKIEFKMLKNNKNGIIFYFAHILGESEEVISEHFDDFRYYFDHIVRKDVFDMLKRGYSPEDIIKIMWNNFKDINSIKTEPAVEGLGEDFIF